VRSGVRMALQPETETADAGKQLDDSAGLRV
jgi:hypothetical protein